MPMQANVAAIFIASSKGAPMQEVASVRASRESGLEGDRYGRGEGSWSTAGKTHQQVTFFAEEDLACANEFLLSSGHVVAPSQTRRGIMLRGFADLNSLIGRVIRISQARFRITKLCTPCTRPALLAGWSDEEAEFYPVAFRDRGGVCAEVIEDGVITAGDKVEIVAA